MVKLRGHHLICLHFFKGAGYSEGFVKNLGRVVKSAEKEGADIVTGGDDVCAACPSFKADMCIHDGDNEQEMRQLDAIALRLLNLKQGHVAWKDMKEVLPSILGEWLKSACNQCEWLSVCETTPLWNSMR